MASVDSQPKSQAATEEDQVQDQSHQSQTDSLKNQELQNQEEENKDLQPELKKEDIQEEIQQEKLEIKEEEKLEEKSEEIKEEKPEEMKEEEKQEEIKEEKQELIKEEEKAQEIQQGGENAKDSGSLEEESKESGLVYQKHGILDDSTPENPKRLYADGVYDMFHLGHALQLKQCKQFFKHVYLIVGVAGDVDTHKLKGQTIQNEKERSGMVENCKWVDEIICPCPWEISDEFLDEHNIRYVCHDDLPYNMGSAEADGDIYSQLKKKGKFLATQRTEGVSTSDLILRIIKDYKKYVIRNLKRGYSRKELGISYFEANKFRFEEKMNRKLSEVKQKLKPKLRQMKTKWYEAPKRKIDAFKADAKRIMRLLAHDAEYLLMGGYIDNADQYNFEQDNEDLFSSDFDSGSEYEEDEDEYYSADENQYWSS